MMLQKRELGLCCLINLEKNPVALYSCPHLLKAPERNLDSHDQDLLAAKLTLDELVHWLVGKKHTVIETSIEIYVKFITSSSIIP